MLRLSKLIQSIFNFQSNSAHRQTWRRTTNKPREIQYNDVVGESNIGTSNYALMSRSIKLPKAAFCFLFLYRSKVNVLVADRLYRVACLLSRLPKANNAYVFLARDSIICYSTLYAIARPSVRLSHGWISQKRLKLGSCNLQHTVAL